MQSHRHTEPFDEPETKDAPSSELETQVTGDRSPGCWILSTPLFEAPSGCRWMELSQKSPIAEKLVPPSSAAGTKHTLCGPGKHSPARSTAAFLVWLEERKVVMTLTQLQDITAKCGGIAEGSDRLQS